MKYARNWLLLSCLLSVFALAIGLRLFRLDLSPRGALIDEAHFGFIARSLLLTGRDEHGQPWPLVFRGFGDQKLPAYAYALVPVMRWWELSVWSIRLPSVLAGSLSVLVIYALARQLGLARRWSLLAAVLLAISPWPFFLSRFGFESNLALFFWLLGLWGLAVLLRPAGPGAHRHSRKAQSEITAAVTAGSWTAFVIGRPAVLAVATGLALALTWYSYIAYRPVTVAVLAVVTVLTLYWQRALWPRLVVVWLALILAVLPLFHPAVNAANTARLQQVGIWSDQRNVAIINEYRTFCDQHLPLTVCSLVWNKGTYAAQTVLSRYLHVFSPQFLVTQGESTEIFLTVKGFGQFLPLFYPFFLLGGWVWLRQLPRRQLGTVLILAGLWLSPLPAVLAGEPQKVRLSPWLPFAILAITIGLAQTAEWWQQQRWLGQWQRWVSGAGVVVLTLGVAAHTTWFLIDYFTVHTVKNDYMYQSYLRDVLPDLAARYPAHQLLIKPFFSDPTMFYAFHTRMDPAAYQQQAVLGPLESSGFQHTQAIDQVKVWEGGFASAACQAVTSNTPTLYLTDERGPAATAVLVRTATSENGAMTYAYVYDALLSGKLAVLECNDIPLPQRQELHRQVEASGLRQQLFPATSD